MKIRRRPEAWKDVDDKRGQSASSGGLGGLGGGAAAKLGIPGVIIALILAVLGGGSILGGDGGSSSTLPDIFNQLPGAQPGTSNFDASTDPNADLADFSATVFLDVQESWEKQFAAAGGTPYKRAQLSPFTGAVQTACGSATSAVGPFYCPGDQHVYIDLDFEKELTEKFGAAGDFAWAYIIAHEVAHHVQFLTGINESVRQQSQKSPTKANDLSVRQELQADCLAGVWGHSAYSRDLLESGDVEEGLLAAERVGDDWIQRNLGSGKVNPDGFTHGTSAQRQKWFNIGFESGDPSECDTFSVGKP